MFVSWFPKQNEKLLQSRTSKITDGI